MPARLRDIKRAAAEYGISVEEPGRGSHWQCRMAGKRVYTIPAHNALRTEVGDAYLAGFCRHFGIDKKEFLNKL